MDPGVKKTVLRWFTYGLHAVTTAHGGEVAMMTANFVTQSSFTPPHVAVAVEVDSHTHRLIEAGRAFARLDGTDDLAPGAGLVPLDDADVAAVGVVEAARARLLALSLSQRFDKGQGKCRARVAS